MSNIPLFHVAFLVQIHNLPLGFMTTIVGTHLGNYIGMFMEYDKTNNTNLWRKYMRIRVLIDVHMPLKKERKVKIRGGDWSMVVFKCERSGTFCFLYGLVGHSNQFCDHRFTFEVDDGSRGWSAELSANSRRRNNCGRSRWLREYGGEFQAANSGNGANSRHDSWDSSAGDRSVFRDADTGGNLNSNGALNVVVHGSCTLLGAERGNRDLVDKGKFVVFHVGLMISALNSMATNAHNPTLHGDVDLESDLHIERKMGRENVGTNMQVDDEAVNGSDYFLSVGPGSQAYRGQWRFLAGTIEVWVTQV